MTVVRKRLLWLLVVITIMLLGGGIAAFVISCREPLLLERATKVADTSDWDFRWTSYYWINNWEVLFFRDSSLRYPVESGWNFFKRDIVTGKETHLTTLTRWANESFGKHSDLAISPDGKRLFWTGAEREDIYCCTLEGKPQIRFDRGRYSMVAWMGDSSHLVEYVMNMNLDHIAYGLIHDLHAPKIPLKITASAEGEFVSTTKHFLGATWLGKGTMDSVTTDSVDISDTPIGHEPQPARSYHVHLPVKAEIWDERFSPQGDRIVWPLLQKDDTPPMLAWLHHHLPILHPDPRPRMSFWVSRIDGSQMHEVGHIPLKYDKEYDFNMDGVPEHIYWLPDGKRLSFWHKDALYIVPAD